MTIDELTASIQKLSDENSDLKKEIEGYRKALEDADADIDSLKFAVQDRDVRIGHLVKEGDKLRAEYSRQNEELAKTAGDRDDYKRRLEAKQNLSVKDLMKILSQNGAQSVLIGFK